MLIPCCMLASCDIPLGDDIYYGYAFAAPYYEILRKDGFAGYETIIPNKIIDYEYDKNFIIVSQNCSGMKMPSTYSYSEKFAKLPWGKDSLTYWIIDKSGNQTLGPYEWDMFINKRDSMGVMLKFYNELPIEEQRYRRNFIRRLLKHDFY